MKRSKFTEEQVAYVLRQAESGTAVEDICRNMGISQATFYWKKKYGELGASEVRRLRQLVEENLRLTACCRSNAGQEHLARGH